LLQDLDADARTEHADGHAQHAADIQSLLMASGGLCLPHLRDVLTLPGASRVYETLMRCHRAAWVQLMGQLEEFIRKNDYRFQDERITPAESQSWTRALAILTGYGRDEEQGSD
jgi:hypothetical protein